MTNHRLIVRLIIASGVGFGIPLSAQTPATIQSTAASLGRTSYAGCPGGNGIHISATSGTLSDSASGVNRVINQTQSVDTTLVFNISLRTWTRTNFAAAITLGLADEPRGRYSICAGVTAMMPSATLTIRGARGRVHFSASLKDLMNSLRLGPGPMSPQPRRL